MGTSEDPPYDVVVPTSVLDDEDDAGAEADVAGAVVDAAAAVGPGDDAEVLVTSGLSRELPCLGIW